LEAQEEAMLVIYVLCFAAVILVLIAGVPVIERSTRLIHPLAPEQEQAYRFFEEARRSIDKFRRRRYTILRKSILDLSDIVRRTIVLDSMSSIYLQHWHGQPGARSC
jgi:hypothetical protein